MWFRRRSESSENSKKALLDARRNLRDVKKQSEEVTAISDVLREFRERNHFAEQLKEIIMGKRGSLS